jgi:hypothetical protein
MSLQVLNHNANCLRTFADWQRGNSGQVPWGTSSRQDSGGGWFAGLTPQKCAKKREKRQKVLAVPGFHGRNWPAWWGLGETKSFVHQDDQFHYFPPIRARLTRLLVIHDVGATGGPGAEEEG